MNQVTRLDRFEPVPDTAWHHVRVARAQQNLRLGTDGAFVAIVEDQLHRSAHDVQELVTVRMDLTTMRSRPIDVGHRSDCVSVNAPWRSRRGRSDGHRPIASDVRNASLEVDRRRIRRSSHAHRVPDRERSLRVQIGGYCVLVVSRHGGASRRPRRPESPVLTFGQQCAHLIEKQVSVLVSLRQQSFTPDCDSIGVSPERDASILRTSRGESGSCAPIWASKFDVTG
jgi:hypothetical protein